MTDQENIFTQPYDVAVLAYSVLKRLGSGSVDYFSERLKCQKYHYFAQLFGVSPVYSFNLYIRGPYSPDLAHDLFEIKNQKIEANTEKFVPEELENRFNALENFIKDKDIRKLELSATLHWLMNIAKLSEPDAKERLKQIKSASAEEVEYAVESVKNL